ncbi:hypothetical protein DITRI_Ditri17bG0135400 [Diplodiscus trichospermus]
MAPPDSEINKASPIKQNKKANTNRKRSSGNGAKQGIPRKRAGKKDRHSKINTAHGPRDRRMRLSLQIAPIKELTENLPGVKHSCSTGGRRCLSYTSKSEVVSAATESEKNMGDQQGVIARGESMRSSATARETKGRKARKISFDPVARESRDKARARARERTREKMKMREVKKPKICSDGSNPNELKRLQYSSSPVESGENSGPFTRTNSNLKVVDEEEEKTHQIPYTC